MFPDNGYNIPLTAKADCTALNGMDVRSFKRLSFTIPDRPGGNGKSIMQAQLTTATDVLPRKPPSFRPVRHVEHLDHAIAAHGKIIYLLTGRSGKLRDDDQNSAADKLPSSTSICSTASRATNIGELPETLWRQWNHIHAFGPAAPCALPSISMPSREPSSWIAARRILSPIS